MDWLSNFFIPLGQVVVILFFVIGISLIITRAIIRTWERKWIFGIKYGLMKKPYNPKHINWILDAINKGKSKKQVQMFLLLKGYKKMKVNEVLYLYDKVKKEMKKGQKNRKVIEGTTIEVFK